MWQRFDFRHSSSMRDSVRAWQLRMQSRPSWVSRPAVLAAVIVFVIPIVLLVLAALLVGLIVFTLLSLVARGIAVVRHVVTAPFGGLSPRGDGRRNVRVRE